MDDNAIQNERPKYVTEVLPESPFAGKIESPVNTNQIDSQSNLNNVVQPAPVENQTQSQALNTNNLPKKKKFALKNLIFLVPATILVATIAIAAYLTSDEYMIKDEVNPVSVSSEIPTPTIMPTAEPKISYQSYSNDNYTFDYPDSFQLAECANSVNLYLKGEQSSEICQRSDFLISLTKINNVPDYMNQEGLVSTESAMIAGTEYLKYEFKAEGSNTVFLPFEIGDDTYLFSLRDILYRTEFLNILASFQLLIDVTVDWPVYEDLLGYSIKYPEDWTIIEPVIDPNKSRNIVQTKTVIRRDNDDSRFQNLVIVAEKNPQASITATQAISSTRQLVGWDETPATELRNLGGANAQIIKGLYEGVWNVYVIVWYRDTIIQMTWEDTNARSFDQALEQMLNSLETE